MNCINILDFLVFFCKSKFPLLSSVYFALYCIFSYCRFYVVSEPGLTALRIKVDLTFVPTLDSRIFT